MKALALLLLLAACGGDDTLPAGAACTTAGDCDPGLDCIELRNQDAMGCHPVGHMCSVSCTDDTPCTPLGAGFHCAGQCGTPGGMFCIDFAP